MRRISIAILILLISLGTVEVRTQDHDLITAPIKNDTICLKCLDDSITMVINSVKMDIAKIDSISRRVRMNTRKISENNNAIYVILNNCGADTVRTYVVDTVKVYHHIEAKKKNGSKN